MISVRVKSHDNNSREALIRVLDRIKADRLLFHGYFNILVSNENGKNSILLIIEKLRMKGYNYDTW